MLKCGVSNCLAVLLVTVLMARIYSCAETEKEVRGQQLNLEDPLEDKEEANKGNWTAQDVRLLLKKCMMKPSSKCFKLFVARALDYLSLTGVQVAPGFTILANSSDALEAAEALRRLLTTDSSGVRVLTPLRQFLGGLTVKMKLEDPNLLRRVKSLSEEVVETLIADGELEGRKKGGGGGAMWAAGALAAAGFAALAAVAGKALMASMAALMMSALAAMRGGGGGGGGGGGHKSSHVEIIKAPAHYELAPLPVHHDGGGYAFEHDHYHYP